ncbi:MAG: class I SAM-dependent methyltransferase [Chloroflexota bacterium]
MRLTDSMHHVRPFGQPTRGKTALNRLRQIDTYIALALPASLSRGTPLVVDVGFGAYAWTTLEMRERWLRINPKLRVIGVEIDPERVQAALPYVAPPAIDFKLGGFNLLDLVGAERVRLIRCYNVLRQYDEAAVDAALQTMALALEPDGILIEGTSTPSGRLVAFDLYRNKHNKLQHVGLIFGTNFRVPIEPPDFQAILPKRLIHHMRAPQPFAFFADWTASYELARGLGHTGQQQWIAAARLLKIRYRYPIDTRLRILRRGYLTLYTTLR